jgi:hypothetical protein
MKKKIFLAALVCTTTFLSACTVTHTTTTIKRITEVNLANGNNVKVGYIAPDASWKCIQVDRKSHTWAMNQFQGMIKLGGGYQVLQEQAVDYANKKNLKANYIYLNVPDQTAVNGFNLEPFADADAVYYQCQNPPALSNKIF